MTLIKHILALVIKFAMVAVILELVLLNMTNLSPINILYVAAAVTLLAYLIGDLFVLDKSNNTVATLADAALAFLTIWAFNYIIPGAVISFSDALIAAVALAVGEWIYHKFVRTAALPPVEKTK